MDKNENIRNDMTEELIELGVASVETKGGPGTGEPLGIGAPVLPGISEE